MKILNRLIILIFVAILVLTVVIVGYIGSRKAVKLEVKTKAINPSVEEPAKTYKTKTDEQAGVTVGVTPQKVDPNADETVFSVSLITHSVSLDFDFRQIAVLRDNFGNEYRATEWTGGRGGHHLSGQIIFPKIKKGTKSLTLIISQIGAVDRSFEWDL